MNNTNVIIIILCVFMFYYLYTTYTRKNNSNYKSERRTRSESFTESDSESFTESDTESFDGSDTESFSESDSESFSESDTESFTESDTESFGESDLVDYHIEDFDTTNNSPIPTDGLVLWLDAYDTKTVELNGNNLITWNDKSPAHYTAIQWNPHAKQATYDSTGLNGLPTVNFYAGNGTNGFVVDIPKNTFISTYGPVTNSKSFIVFVVSQRVGPPGEREATISRSYGNVSAPFYMYNTTRMFGHSYKYTFVESPFDQRSNTDININVFCIIGGTYTEYLNGKLILTQDVSQFEVSDDANFFAIGSGADNHDGFNGNISEVIAYNSNLTPDQILNVSNYLKDKWILKKPQSSGQDTVTASVPTPATTPAADFGNYASFIPAPTPVLIPAPAPVLAPVVPRSVFVPQLITSSAPAPQIIPVHPPLESIKSCNTNTVIPSFEYSVIGYINDNSNLLPYNMGPVSDLANAIKIAQKYVATTFQITSKNILYIGFYYNKNKVQSSKKPNDSTVYSVKLPAKLLKTPTTHPYKIFSKYAVPLKNIYDIFPKSNLVGKVSTDADARKLANKYSATAFWVDSTGNLYITYNFNALLVSQTNENKSKVVPYNQIYYMGCLFNKKHSMLSNIMAKSV